MLSSMHTLEKLFTPDIFSPLSEHEQSQTGNKENKGKKVKKT